MVRSGRLLAGAGAAALLAGCAGTIRDRIYQPGPTSTTPVRFKSEAPRQVVVTTTDGLRLSGYHWPAQPGRPLVVYFHGNGFNQLVGAARAEPLRAGGHGVLVASYRGYGGNGGKPSEQGLVRDGEAWMAEARRLSNGRPLFVFGHSLGGAVALAMATRYEVGGVATLGTFARLADMAPPIARGLLPDRFDNLAAISRVRAPILLLHGDRDAIVPFIAGERLAAASRGRAELVRLPGQGHHVDLAALADRLWAKWDHAPARN